MRSSLIECYDDRSVIAKLNKMQDHVTEQDADIESVTATANQAVIKAQELEGRVDDIASRMGTVFKIKGSITNAGLASITDQQVGDVWNITNTGIFPAGSNVVWTGTEWDKMSETVDLTPVNERIDGLENHIGDVDTPNTLAYDIEANKNSINEIADTYQLRPVFNTITLTGANWVGGEQTVEYLHRQGELIIADASDGYKDACVEFGVYLSSATTTSLTFKCGYTPTSDIGIVVTKFEI